MENADQSLLLLLLLLFLLRITILIGSIITHRSEADCTEPAGALLIFQGQVPILLKDLYCGYILSWHWSCVSLLQSGKMLGDFPADDVVNLCLHFLKMYLTFHRRGNACTEQDARFTGFGLITRSVAVSFKRQGMVFSMFFLSQRGCAAGVGSPPAGQRHEEGHF